MPAEAGQYSIGFFNVYYKQDRALSPYLVMSCLAIGLFFFGLFFYKNLFCKSKENRLSQLIDIELISQTDFKDKKNLLPATAAKPSLAKRTSPIMSSKGQLFSEPIFIVRAAARANKKKEEIKDEHKEEVQMVPKIQASSSDKLIDKTDLTNRYLPLNVPFSQISSRILVANATAKKNVKSIAPMDMEEVKPPELLEVKENEGDNSFNHWQEGGNSIKGLGVSSSLADYLKDLHKKLKRAWSPPPGTVHHIKVIFRLNKTGNLISMQLTQSCGNKIADDSAFAAIKNAAPFGKLPNDYTLQFLDLAYTFNYTTDELSEIHHDPQE